MSKKSNGILLATVTACSLIAVAMSPAQARNDVSMINIDQVLKSDDGKAQIDSSVHFYFGAQKHPAAVSDFSDATVEGKARGDTDYLACSKAFLGALTDLQTQAKKMSANAVVGVHSFFKHKENFSNTQVECHSGAFSSVVMLKGHIISTKK